MPASEPSYCASSRPCAEAGCEPSTSSAAAASHADRAAIFGRVITGDPWPSGAVQISFKQTNPANNAAVRREREPLAFRVRMRPLYGGLNAGNACQNGIFGGMIPEKCAAVFRKDHAQTKSQSAMANYHAAIAL